MALTKSSVLLLILMAVCVRGDGTQVTGARAGAIASGAGQTPILHDIVAGMIALPGLAARAKLDLLYKWLNYPGAETPGVPRIPGTPGTPGVPRVPGVPGTPGVPHIPGVPGVAVSGARQTAGTPPVAGTPGKAGVPARAGSPATQAVPICNLDGRMKDLSLKRTLQYLHDAKIDIPAGSTFFAPTDEAWTAFLSPYSAKQRTVASDPRLLNLLLRNHVAPGGMLTSLDLHDDMRIPTELKFQSVLRPETLRVANRDVYRGSLMPTKLYTLRTSDASAAPAKITIVDQESTCAVMHVVDRVLAPGVLVSILASPPPKAGASATATARPAAVQP